MTDKPNTKRRRFGGCLKVLLLFALLAILGVAWLAFMLHRARTQREAATDIRKLGGRVFYNCWYNEFGILLGEKPPGPPWLTSLLGTDFFGSVQGVKLTEEKYLPGLGDFQFVSRPVATITDDHLVHLQAFPQLQWLALNHGQITDDGLRHLQGLAKLERLWLDDTQITNAGLERLQEFAKLTALSLSNTQVSDAGLKHLEPLTNLQILRLDHTNCTFSGVVRFLTVDRGYGLADALRLVGYGTLDDDGNVLALDLSRIGARDSELKLIQKLAKLQWLFLNGTQVTDAGLVHLQALTNLQLLHLAETQVTDAGLEHLKRLPNLRTLHLTGTQVTDQGVQKFKRAMPNTLRIYLSGRKRRQ